MLWGFTEKYFFGEGRRGWSLKSQYTGGLPKNGAWRVGRFKRKLRWIAPPVKMLL